MDENVIDKKKEIVKFFKLYKDNTNVFCVVKCVNMPKLTHKPHFVMIEYIEQLSSLEKLLRNYNDDLIFDSELNFSIIVDCYFTDHKKELEKRKFSNDNFITRRLYQAYN